MVAIGLKMEGPSFGFVEDVHVSHQAIALFLESARGSENDVQWQAEGAAGGFVREIAFDDDTPMMVWLTEPAALDVERLNSLRYPSM